MKPNELFGVVVRVIGLIGLLYLLREEVNLLFSGMLPMVLALGWGPILESILGIFISIYFLRGAPALVRFAFPPSE
jgi:hypothetical protein